MQQLKRFWQFLKEDTWQSWIVSLVLTFVFIKWIFFPLLSFAFGTPLPLVVVESCSMYHESSFDGWWDSNGIWYTSRDDDSISKEQFEQFSFKNGLNKGDVILVWGKGSYNPGDVIIFNANYTYPLIHRIVSEKPLATKGDHNPDQLPVEREINNNAVIGKAIARIPGLGWIKLIFFEGFKPQGQRGFCR